MCPTSAGAQLQSAPRFSIVILTRNEERRLPRLLDDLREFSDRGGDVVVVDSGSTDNTLAIAKRAGCRVETVNDRFDSLLDSAQAAEIERRFARAGEGPLVMAGQRLFHFGEAREYAGGLAANSFVLQIDASDEVPALDIDEFDMWIGSQGVHAFEYNQRYGNVGLRIARFYDRSQYHWEGRVHEILSTTIRHPCAGVDHSVQPKAPHGPPPQGRGQVAKTGGARTPDAGVPTETSLVALFEPRDFLPSPT